MSQICKWANVKGIGRGLPIDSVNWKNTTVHSTRLGRLISQESDNSNYIYNPLLSVGLLFNKQSILKGSSSDFILPIQK